MRITGLGLLFTLIFCGTLTSTALGQTPATQPTTQGARRGGGARGPTAPQLMAPRDAQPYTPSDFSKCDPKLPTLVIAGDSTADGGPDAWHRGWAAPLIDYFDTTRINVVNRSRGGRSFRSFVREGLWDQLVANLKPGDFVMIQMGHNDGNDGPPVTAQGRTELPGLGEETQDVTGSDGKVETVHTFGWYARKWIKDVRDKGATPVVMSQTIYNRWKPDGTYNRSEPNIFKWAKQTAESEKVMFLDHTNIIADRFEQLGQDAVRPYYAADPLHTTTYGAVVNAELFVSGVKQLDIKVLVDALNVKGMAIAAYKPTAKP